MADIRKRTGIVFLVAVIAQVLLISAQVQTKSGVRAIEAVSFGLFARVQSAASSSVRGVRDVWTNYAALRGARDENEALKKQLADLSVELQQQRGLAARATKFQELLDLKSSIDLPTVAAEVIAGNANPGMRQITIGRGTADGVQANMAVISSRGVVGRIVGRPAAHAARVQLIIDHSAAAGALTERTRAGGMVTGVDKQPPLAMELVSNLADVKQNDAVVTSGVDGIYPKGYTIGWVDSVARGPGLYQVITVRPAVDFSSLEEVLVVIVPSRPASADTEEKPATAPPVSQMKGVVVIAGLALALLFQTTLSGMALDAGTKVNFVVVAVILIALTMGPVTGLLSGTVGGLVQDAVAGGIVGIGGISKTIVGFAVGVFGSQFIVSQPIPRLVIFVGGTFLHELCFQALYAVAEAHAIRFHYREVLTQAIVNGLIGIAVFYVIENAPGMKARREARRATFGRRQF